MAKGTDTDDSKAPRPRSSSFKKDKPNEFADFLDNLKEEIAFEKRLSQGGNLYTRQFLLLRDAVSRIHNNNEETRISLDFHSASKLKDAMAKRSDQLIDALLISYGIDQKFRESAFKDIAEIANRYAYEAGNSKDLQIPPSAPLRDYNIDKEDIIDYIKSSDGFEFWVKSKTLTRPFIRQTAPKAYRALSNWLRNNKLPSDLPIPTKSELVAQAAKELAASPDAAETVREASRKALKLRRLASRAP